MKTEAQFSPAAVQFVESVLALRPRVAVFDCDGTLWSGDCGADFFYWEIERSLVPPNLAELALARYHTSHANWPAPDASCGPSLPPIFGRCARA